MLCHNFESIIFEGYLLMFFVLSGLCNCYRLYKFRKFLLDCISQFS